MYFLPIEDVKSLGATVSPSKPSSQRRLTTIAPPTSNTFIEGCSHKIRRQLEDLEKVSGILSSSLTVDGVPVDTYLTKLLGDTDVVM
nr:V-type proton ATPase subunit C-like [Tanacetum cinerariifolium]